MATLRIVPLILGIGMVLIISACGAEEPSVDQAVVATGKALYVEHCATCHGVNLEGQPNWKVPNADGVYPAPPHNRDGHTWHHPDAVLLDIIAAGGTMPKSAMPAFGDRLSHDQMESILVYIKSFWGTEELEFQREVTQSMQGQSD